MNTSYYNLIPIEVFGLRVNVELLNCVCQDLENLMQKMRDDQTRNNPELNNCIKLCDYFMSLQQIMVLMEMNSSVESKLNNCIMLCGFLMRLQKDMMKWMDLMKKKAYNEQEYDDPELNQCILYCDYLMRLLKSIMELMNKELWKIKVYNKILPTIVLIFLIFLVIPKIFH